MSTLSLLAIDVYKTAEAFREEERLVNERQRLMANIEEAMMSLKKALGIAPELLWDTENPPEPRGPFIFQVSDLIFEVQNPVYSWRQVFLRTGKCQGCGEQLTTHLAGLVYWDDLEQAKKQNYDVIGKAILGGPDHHTCPQEEGPPAMPKKRKTFEEEVGEKVLELFTEIANAQGVKWED